MQLLRGPWSNAVVELPCWGTAWNSCFISLPPHGLWSWEPTGQGPAVLPGWKLLLLSHSLLPWDHPELTWMDLHHGVTPDPPWCKGHELWLLHFPFAWKGLSAAREKHQTEKRRAACGFGEGHFPVSSNRHLPKEPNPNTFAGLFTAPEFLLFQSDHDLERAGVASFICSEHLQDSTAAFTLLTISCPHDGCLGLHSIPQNVPMHLQTIEIVPWPAEIELP